LEWLLAVEGRTKRAGVSGDGVERDAFGPGRHARVRRGRSRSTLEIAILFPSECRGADERLQFLRSPRRIRTPDATKVARRAHPSACGNRAGHAVIAGSGSSAVQQFLPRCVRPSHIGGIDPPLVVHAQGDDLLQPRAVAAEEGPPRVRITRRRAVEQSAGSFGVLASCSADWSIDPPNRLLKPFDPSGAPLTRRSPQLQQKRGSPSKTYRCNSYPSKDRQYYQYI
jgi:hypothetical protein